MYVVYIMSGTIEKHEAKQDGEYLVINGHQFYEDQKGSWTNRLLNDKRAYERLQDAKDYVKLFFEEEIESLSELIDHYRECLEYTESLDEEDFDEDIQDKK
jgi:hypothetical protein